MNTNNPSPIHASVQPLQGQQLPASWKQEATTRGKQADENYQQAIENAWKRPSNEAGIMQQARLRNRMDSGFVGHQQQNRQRQDGHNERLDALELIEERGDGWACYRDRQSGAVVWRRLAWSEVLGQK
jgi:hypothetical protein